MIKQNRLNRLQVTRLEMIAHRRFRALATEIEVKSRGVKAIEVTERIATLCTNFFLAAEIKGLSLLVWAIPPIIGLP